MRINKFTYTIREFGRIVPCEGEQKECNNPDYCEIPIKTFNNLKKFIFENIEYSKEISKSFHYSVWRRTESIQVKNYVGVIETADGGIIEILPKIYLSNEQESNKTIISETKNIFLKMLKHLKKSPFAEIDNAHLNTQKFPLLEIFITTFIKELEKLIKFGIKQSYVEKEENIRYYKGKLKVSENVRYNHTNKAMFYMQFDEYSCNIAQNRLIKSTIQYLLKKSNLSENKISLNRLSYYFEDILESRNVEKDFTLISGQNRLYSHYKQVLNWASVFLRNESFISFKGKHLNKAILFPMERIFEDYVGYLFKKYDESERIEIQKSKHWLVDNHNERGKFRLKPDFVTYTGNNINIYDTKWKIINQNLPSKNYEIKQSDMYQLFAYGKKYKIKNNENEKIVSLFLLYPKTEKFDKTLPIFEYNKNLILKAVPVDLNLSAKEIFNDIASVVNTNITPFISTNSANYE